MTRHTAEKRSHPRIDKNIPIKINSDDFDIVTETENISCSGVYCKVDRYVAPFTKIKTKILLPAKTKGKHLCLDCSGIVVRIEKDDNDLEDQYSMAIYFNDMRKASTDKINRFIKERDNT